MLRQLNPSQGNLTERVLKQTDIAAAVRDAFLTILSRPPSDDELNRGAEFLAVEEKQRRETCREFVWALLCSSEFRFNH